MSNLTGKTLAIIGASSYQLPLVEAAHRLGVKVICFSWPQRAVCKDVADKFFPVSIVEKEEIAEICQREGIDGVTTIATDVAVPTVAYVATKMGLIGNTEHSAYICTNKFAMREALQKGGVNCPEFFLVKNQEEAVAAFRKLGAPVIIKPCDRSSSIAVTRVDSEEELLAALPKALDVAFCKAAVVERFIENAREISVEGISWEGNYYPLAFTDKDTSGYPHFVEIGQHQPALLTEEQKAAALEQVKLGVNALGIRYGASHPELMLAPDGKVYVTEIGGRMGGDFIGSYLVRLSTGYDFVEGVVKVALGEFTPPVFTEQRSAGVWFSSPQTPSVGKIIAEHEKYPELYTWEVPEKQPTELSESGDRSGYFIYCSDRKFIIE